MDPDRLATLLSDLDNDRRNGTDVGERLCDTCVEVLDVTGAGIMLMSDGEHRGTLGVSNGVMTVVEDLQFTLGEGPCIDAYASDHPILEPDLGAPVTNRWPAFSGPAVRAGVRAVFGFPLRTGTVNLGALDVYLDHPGDLRTDQVSDAVVMAGVISRTVLALQADAAPGELPPLLDATVHHRAVVHQASGMVSAQLDIDVADALVRIRAHAYTSNRPVNDVAHDIVDRRLRLD
ncbi:MAG: GAF and ANTAR domain-containing protein [Acidimicrobiia bacterium]|nr:GAF and ANTAR domain-containing protein [Acidimicrobiia bacterium]